VTHVPLQLIRVRTRGTFVPFCFAETFAVLNIDVALIVLKRESIETLTALSCVVLFITIIHLGIAIVQYSLKPARARCACACGAARLCFAVGHLLVT